MSTCDDYLFTFFFLLHANYSLPLFGKLSKVCVPAAAAIAIYLNKQSDRLNEHVKNR